MGMRSAIVLALCAATFLFAPPRGSGGRRGVIGLSFEEEDEKVTSLSGAEKEMMEQIWTNCKLELLGIKFVMRASDLLIPDSIAGDFTEPLKEDMQETLARLSPDMKCPHIDCLIRQCLHPADNSINRYATNFPRVLSQDPLLRRRLADQPVQGTSPASASSPAPALRPRHRIQTPIAAPATAPAPPPNPNPHLGVIPHAPVPSSAPTESSIPENDPKGLSPTPFPHGYLEPEVVHPISQLPVAPPEHKNISTKMIIIVVVVTATATFTLAALCFCCCNRYVGNNYQTVNGQKDDRPLLSLSLSDFSGSSRHKDKFGSSSFNPRQSDQVSSFATTADGHSAASSSNEFTNAPGNPFPPAAPSPPSLKPPPGKTSAPSPPPPPLPKPKTAPPPPAAGPPPPKGGPSPQKGPRPQQANSSSSAIPRAPSKHSVNGDDNSNGTKIKLKPFFWDKVNANPDQSMVWHQIKSGSFQFNEEMIEMLFGYNAADKLRNDVKKDLGNNSSSQRIQILDPKKSQNLAISLKAQNVKVEEVCDALVEGNELPVELLQTLLRMAPTTDEELKLRLFNDDSVFLGPAEQFLKNIVNIPFAFKRMEALLFMTSLKEESSNVKESFATLEEACMELRNSRLFLKLLEAVLKTGNRMNDGTFRGGAQAFKLDTLLKLSDVKGADGKTTLLHFVVQEIIRSEGRRAMRVARENRSNSNITISSFNSEDSAEDVPDETEDQYRNIGLRAVSSLIGELENVKKAAGLDADVLTSSVTNLVNRLVKTKEFLNTDMRNLEEESGFHNSLKAFVEHAEAHITRLLDEEKGIRLLVKSISDYFHGNSGRNEGLRLFVVVRDFLGILDKVCKEVIEAPKKMVKESRRAGNPVLQPIQEPQLLLFPAIKDRRMDDFSSEGEDD